MASSPRVKLAAAAVESGMVLRNWYRWRFFCMNSVNCTLRQQKRHPIRTHRNPDRSGSDRAAHAKTLERRTRNRRAGPPNERTDRRGRSNLPVTRLPWSAHQLVRVEDHHLVLVGLVDEDALHGGGVGRHHREVAANHAQNALHCRRDWTRFLACVVVRCCARREKRAYIGRERNEPERVHRVRLGVEERREAFGLFSAGLIVLFFSLRDFRRAWCFAALWRAGWAFFCCSGCYLLAGPGLLFLLWWALFSCCDANCSSQKPDYSQFYWSQWCKPEAPLIHLYSHKCWQPFPVTTTSSRTRRPYRYELLCVFYELLCVLGINSLRWSISAFVLQGRKNRSRPERKAICSLVSYFHERTSKST